MVKDWSHFYCSLIMCYELVLCNSKRETSRTIFSEKRYIIWIWRRCMAVTLAFCEILQIWHDYTFTFYFNNHLFWTWKGLHVSCGAEVAGQPFVRDIKVQCLKCTLYRSVLWNTTKWYGAIFQTINTVWSKISCRY